MAFSDRDFRKYIEIASETLAVNAANVRARADAVARRIIELLDGGGGGINPPSPPTNVVATAGEFSIAVTWDAVSGADSYRIFGSDNGASFSTLATTTNLSFTETGLAADETRFYRVTAIEDDLESANSVQVSATTTGGSAPGAPTTPANFSGDFSAAHAATLSWDALTGTGVAVNIYRSMGTGAFSLLVDGVTGTSFTDGRLPIGTTYNYFIRSVNEAGAESTSTATVSGVITDGDSEAPPVPGTMTASAGDGSVGLAWGAVFADDLAGYSVGYSAVSGGPYTFIDTVRDTGTISGLTNGTTYFFVVKSFDGAQPSRNESALTPEVSATPADPGGTDTTPPDAPDGFSAISRSSLQLDLSWALNDEPDLALYHIYRRETGSKTPFNRITGAGLAASTASYRDETFTKLSYDYHMTAEDVSGNESTISETLTLASDGANKAVGEGAGNVGDGIDGDTGFGTTYRAPGYFFDYVIDLSSVASENVMVTAAGVFNNRTALPSTDPDYIDLTGRPTIAVLLPVKTEGLGVNLSPGNLGGSARANFDIFDREFNIHFIAPWIGTLGSTKEQTMIRVRDGDETLAWSYKLEPKDADNNALPNSGGGTTLGINWDDLGWEGQIHFWNWEMEGAGRECVSFGSSPFSTDYSRTSFDQEVHFHLCKLHQNNINFPGGAPKWGFSGYHMKMNWHGMWIDVPFCEEHAAYLREQAYGDQMFEYVKIDRAGGQLMQIADRDASEQSGGPADSLRPADLEPGINTFRHWKGVIRGGRSITRANGFFSFKQNHQGHTFEDMILAEIDDEDTQIEGWPPGDPLGDIGGPPYQATMGVISLEKELAPDDKAEVAAPGGSWRGYHTGPLYMRRCVFYSHRPTKAMLRIYSAPTVDIEDCAFFTGIANASPAYDSGGFGPTKSQARISIVEQGADPEVFGGPPVGSFRWVGCNTAAHKTQLEAAPFNLTAADMVTPDVRIGEELAQIATADQDITWTSFESGLYEAGTDPENLTVT